MRWIVVVVVGLAACGGTEPPQERPPGEYTSWSGAVSTAPSGGYNATLYLRIDQDGGIIGSYVTDTPALGGWAVSGIATDGGVALSIRSTSCDAGLDAGGRIVGTTMRFEYAGSTCAGPQSATATLKQDYDLPAP